MNTDCATGSGRPLNHDRAAAKAIELARSKGKEGLCIPLDGSLSKTSSTTSLTNNTISKTPSSVSNVSSVGEPLPEERRMVSPNQTPEPMETTESTTEHSRLQPHVALSRLPLPAASSTDSVGSTGNPLILIHSRASTGDTPPVSRRHMPDPSGLSASSSSESGMSGPTGLTTTTSASVVSVSLSTSNESMSDSLSNISMDLSSSDTQSSRHKSSARQAFASDSFFETDGKS